jgi:hypothetical protein
MAMVFDDPWPAPVGIQLDRVTLTLDLPAKAGNTLFQGGLATGYDHTLQKALASFKKLAEPLLIKRI